MKEFCDSSKFRQLSLPSFELDEESKICQNPYAYLRKLVEEQVEPGEITLSLSGNNFEIFLTLDREGFYQSTAVPPFISVSTWMETSIKIILIYPHDPETGETQNQWAYQEQISVINIELPPAPPEIAWLSDEHQQAAQVALFINNLVSNQAPTKRSS